MEQKIMSAIELYLSEPTSLIRAIPDPEVLTSFIVEALREEFID
jgi:hypothetical protein